MKSDELREYFSVLSGKSRNRLFSLWMSGKRIEGSEALDLMFDMDDEFERIYIDNRMSSFSDATLIANEHLLWLVYGDLGL